MSDEKINVKTEVELWPFALIIWVVLCWGSPDLLDVLGEWCRRYMEARP